MNIVLPVFPANAEEAALLCQEAGGVALGLRLMRALARLPGARVHLFTDQPWLMEQARGMTARAHLLDSPDHEPPCALWPRGTRACLAHPGLEHCGPGRKIMVLDYRAARLDADTVKAAWDRAKRPDPALLISVAQTREHPALLNAGYRILKLDTACLLDDRLPADLADSPVAGRVSACTRPFYFNWPPACLPANHAKVLVVSPGESGRVLLPAALEHCGHEDEVFLYHHGAATARRLRIGKQDPAAAGFSVLFREEPPHVLLTRDIEAAEMRVHVSTALAGPDVVARVWEFDAQGIRDDGVREFAVLDPGPSRRTQAFGHDYTGPMARYPDDESRWGVVVALLERSRGGEMDVVEPLLVAQDLWSCAGASSIRVRASDSRPMHGRQDLMPVYVPDGTMLIAAREVLPLAEALAAQGRACGFRLPKGRQVKMRSRFDLLRMDVEETLSQGGEQPLEAGMGTRCPH